MTTLAAFAGRAAARAGLAALLATLAFALLSLVAASRDPAMLREQVRPLVADGTLYGVMSLPFGSRAVPAWEGNDCLVLMMLVAPRESLWRDALSPRVPLRPGPHPSDTPIELAQMRCLRLAELLDPTAPAEASWHYDRYLHGQRVVAAILVPWLGLRGLRSAVTVGLVAALGGLALLAAARAWRRRATPAWPRHAGFAWIALGLLLFQGVPMFGRYWSHALSDLVPAVFLWLLYLRPPRMGTPPGEACDAGPAALLGTFGCCVALFEFLTGGLPLGAALVLLVAAVQPRTPSLGGCIASLAAFGVGVLVPFLVKFAIGHLAFADFLTAEAGGQLLHRIYGPVVPEMSPREIALVAAMGFDAQLLDRVPLLRVPYALFRFAYFGFVPGAGATWLGLLVLGGSAVGVPLLAWRARRAGGDAAARAAAVLGACGIVLLWYAVFLSHTLLHAAWMVRCTVVLPLALGLLLIGRLQPHGLPVPREDGAARSAPA